MAMMRGSKENDATLEARNQGNILYCVLYCVPPLHCASQAFEVYGFDIANYPQFEQQLAEAVRQVEAG